MKEKKTEFLNFGKQVSEDLKKLGKVYVEKQNRIWVKVPLNKLLKTCESLRHEYGVIRVISISGRDAGKSIEVIYHLELGHGVISVKTEVPKKNDSVPTLTKIFPSANLFERELAEMLGIKVEDHPNLKKLFLPPEIENPLRRSD